MKIILILLCLIILIPKESNGFEWISYYKRQILDNQRMGLHIATFGVKAQFAQAEATNALAAAQERLNGIKLQIHHDKQGREDAKVADSFIFERLRKVLFSEREFDKWLYAINFTVGRFNFDEKDNIAFILGMRKNESDQVNTMIWLEAFCTLVDDYKPINYDVNELCQKFTCNSMPAKDFFGQTYHWLMNSEKDAIDNARENTIRDLKGMIEIEAKNRWPAFKELADQMNAIKNGQVQKVNQFISDIPAELDSVDFDEWMKEIDEIEPQLTDNDAEKNVRLFVGMRKNSKLIVNNIWINAICRNNVKDNFNWLVFTHVKNFCEKFSNVTRYEYFNISFPDLAVRLKDATAPSCDKLETYLKKRIPIKKFEIIMERMKEVEFSPKEFDEWMKNIDDISGMLKSFSTRQACRDKLMEMHNGTGLVSKFIWIRSLCWLRIQDDYTINKKLYEVCLKMDARPATAGEYLGARFSYSDAEDCGMHRKYEKVINEETKRMKDEILKVKDKWPSPPLFTRIGKIFHKK